MAKKKKERHDRALTAISPAALGMLVAEKVQVTNSRRATHPYRRANPEDMNKRFRIDDTFELVFLGTDMKDW